jgi:hypothetical protein
VSLDLESSRWKELTHAYGSAENVPALLRQLETAPAQSAYTDEPWYTLWSSLCHQGDVYTATYAAIPHVIAIAACDSGRRRIDLLSFVITCEAFRHKRGTPAIPADLERDYVGSLNDLHKLVLESIERDLNSDEFRVLLAGIALSKGHARLANVLLSLDESFQCLNCEYDFAADVVETAPKEN